MAAARSSRSRRPPHCSASRGKPITPHPSGGAFGFAESLRAELRKEAAPVSTLVVAPYFVDTGMFAGARTKFPLLLPILQERDVARRILDAVESGRQQLIMPAFARLTPLLRVLPPIAFDAVTDFLGINHTMDEFTGRSPTRT